MYWTAILLLSAAMVFCQMDPHPGCQKRGITLSYTGNMGVLIRSDKTSIWVDGVHTFYEREYQHTPDSLLHLALNKMTPFNCLELLLFSHFHRDHFSATVVKRMHKSNPDIKVIGASQVIDSLPPGAGINGWNTNSVIYDNQENRIQVEAYDLPHSGQSRHGQVRNLMFSIVINGIRITHLGDAETDDHNFRAAAFIQSDLLIVPYWFLSGEKGKAILNLSNAKKIIATHIPPGGHNSNLATQLHHAEVVEFDDVGESVLL